LYWRSSLPLVSLVGIIVQGKVITKPEVHGVGSAFHERVHDLASAKWDIHSRVEVSYVLDREVYGDRLTV
jgi:hypothetical protein